MQQPRAVKFNFDNVFGSKGNGAATRSSYSVEEVETIRRDTFVEGKAEVEAQASAARAMALAAIAQGLTEIIAQMDAALAALRQDSAQVALDVARKVATNALSAFPLKEVEALVADCLHKLHREPRLVVRLSPDCAEALRADIDALCQQHGYAGRVVIVPEPALSGANCRVEWADGGIERDLTATFAAIDESFERWRTSPSAEEN